LATLEKLSDDELYSMIGMYQLSEEPRRVQTLMASKEGIMNMESLIKKGKDFLKKRNFKTAICGTSSIVDGMKAADIAAIILPLLGYSVTAAVPLAIIAAVLLIIRIGIKVYCRGYEKPAPAKA